MQLSRLLVLCFSVITISAVGNAQYNSNPTHYNQHNSNQYINPAHGGGPTQNTNQHLNNRSFMSLARPPPTYYCNIKTIDNFCVFENLNLNHGDRAYFGTEDNTEQRIAFKTSTLRYLPRNLIRAFPYIQILRAEDLNMATIDRDAFQNANNLEELYLNNNLFQFLSQQSLGGATSLRILQLSNNIISTIHENIFTQMPELRLLFLDGNRIKRLPKLFDNPELIVVNVSRNQLSTIEPDHFYNNPKLEAIDISFNNLQSFELEPLNPLSNLLLVNVDFNQLQKLNIPHSVQFLYAKNNSIENVITSQYCKLQTLVLTSNLLQSIDLTTCQYLKSLELSQNRLQEFNFNLVPHQLEHLNLANNQIFVLTLPTRKTALKEMDLSNNYLSYVPTTKTFEQLQNLRLNNNKIISFDFTTLKSLQSIYLSNNEWHCEKLASIYNKVLDRHSNPCLQDGYTNSYGICCRIYVRPYNQRLNEIIREIDFQEKQNLETLKEHCDHSQQNHDSGKFRPADIEQLREEAAQSDTEKRDLLQRLAKIREEQSNLRTQTTDVERQLLELNNQWKQMTVEIEKQRDLHAVIKEGLESPQEMFEKLIGYVNSRDKLHADVLSQRVNETSEIENQLEQMTQEKESLEALLVTLQTDYDQLAVQGKERKKQKDMLERQANRNAPSIKGST